MNGIDLKEEQLAIVQKILRSHFPVGTKIFLFGSRATGKAKAYSDIDLAIDANQPLTIEKLAKLTVDFEDSLLPYKVDIVDLHNVDVSFKQIIIRDGKSIF